MVTPPVASGESVIEPSMRRTFGFVGRVTHQQQAAPLLYSGYHRTAGKDEIGSAWEKEQRGGYSWVKICPLWHPCPFWDGFREAEG
jgi:hypothetical protein